MDAVVTPTEEVLRVFDRHELANLLGIKIT
jgi:hypothetical protein